MNIILRSISINLVVFFNSGPSFNDSTEPKEEKIGNFTEEANLRFLSLLYLSLEIWKECEGDFNCSLRSRGNKTH